MVDDQYKLKDKSNTELYEWMAEYKPGTIEYAAGIQESMRRVACIQESIQRSEAPVRARELIAVSTAFVFLVMTIIVIVLAY